MLAESIRELVIERLQEKRTIKFNLITTSMVPALVPGDQITVICLTDKLPSIGAIVLTENGGIWVAHRLVSRKKLSSGYWLTIKGDNNNCADLPCELSDLKGIVVAVVRGNRVFDYSSIRARILGFWIAWLSFVQGNLYRPRLRFFRRVVLAGLHRIIKFLALVGINC
jgi:hypothetical protein